MIAYDRDPVASVLRFLESNPADLIVLAPHQHHGRSHWLRRSVRLRAHRAPVRGSHAGRNGFLDALRGTHSERVLRAALCPLLAIPETAFVTQRLKLD